MPDSRILLRRIGVSCHRDDSAAEIRAIQRSSQERKKSWVRNGDSVKTVEDLKRLRDHFVNQVLLQVTENGQFTPPRTCFAVPV